MLVCWAAMMLVVWPSQSCVVWVHRRDFSSSSSSTHPKRVEHSSQATSYKLQVQKALLLDAFSAARVLGYMLTGTRPGESTDEALQKSSALKRPSRPTMFFAGSSRPRFRLREPSEVSQPARELLEGAVARFVRFTDALPAAIDEG